MDHLHGDVGPGLHPARRAADARPVDRAHPAEPSGALQRVGTDRLPGKERGIVLDPRGWPISRDAAPRAGRETPAPRPVTATMAVRSGETRIRSMRSSDRPSHSAGSTLRAIFRQGMVCLFLLLPTPAALAGDGADAPKPPLRFLGWNARARRSGCARGRRRGRDPRAGRASSCGGRTRAGGDEGARPVEVKSFFVDKHEVTNERFARFFDRATSRAPARCTCERTPGLGVGGRSGRGTGAVARRRARGDYPVTAATGHGALAYARWAGGRLPSAVEWEKAAAARRDGSSRGATSRAGRDASRTSAGRGARAIPVGSFAAGASPTARSTWRGTRTSACSATGRGRGCPSMIKGGLVALHHPLTCACSTSVCSRNGSRRRASASASRDGRPRAGPPRAQPAPRSRSARDDVRGGRHGGEASGASRSSSRCCSTRAASATARAPDVPRPAVRRVRERTPRGGRRPRSRATRSRPAPARGRGRRVSALPGPHLHAARGRSSRAASRWSASFAVARPGTFLLHPDRVEEAPARRRSSSPRPLPQVRRRRRRLPRRVREGSCRDEVRRGTTNTVMQHIHDGSSFEEWVADLFDAPVGASCICYTERGHLFDSPVTALEWGLVSSERQASDSAGMATSRWRGG